MNVAAIETIRLTEFPNLIWVIVEDSAGNRGLGETFFGAEAVEAARSRCEACEDAAQSTLADSDDENPVQAGAKCDTG